MVRSKKTVFVCGCSMAQYLGQERKVHVEAVLVLSTDNPIENPTKRLDIRKHPHQ